jgi:hypothetical protein
MENVTGSYWLALMDTDGIKIRVWTVILGLLKEPHAPEPEVMLAFQQPVMLTSRLFREIFMIKSAILRDNTSDWPGSARV